MKEIKDISDLDLISEYEGDGGVPFVDNLTGLFNHGFFQISLERELKRCQRYGLYFTLALIDVDSFSLLNRRKSHLHGDLVLKKLAGLIQENIRTTDLAGRFSGDVIALILINSDIQSSLSSIERIRLKFEETYSGDVTLSAGLASYPRDATDRNCLITKAQEALLKAKMRGKNKVQFFEEKTTTVDENPKILVVDDEPRNVKLLSALLQNQSYEVAFAYSGEEALAMMKKVDLDLVLLDIMMPEMDGYEVCRRLKQDEGMRHIPVVMITALDDMESKVKGIEAGANDFLTKPPNKIELLTRVKSLIHIKKLNQDLISIESVLFSLANAIEAKDSYTQGHIERVSSLAVSLGRNMGLSRKQMDNLKFGGILHDIGKVGIPGSIINKPGPLSPAEWEVMKKHCAIGYNISIPLKKNLGQALDVIRGHHEKLDGTGYPDGLKGDEIHTETRIMAVVDIYDALVTDRPYRKGMPKERAFEILRSEVEKGKLDTEVVKALINLIGKPGGNAEEDCASGSV